MSKELEVAEKPSYSRLETITPKAVALAAPIKQDEPPKIFVPELAIPPRPKLSQETADYPRLCEIEQKLQAQNKNRGVR